MKRKIISALALFACVATSAAATFSGKIFHNAPPSNAPISGDYVEARTASVFAGACHFNGEYVTIGREAVLAWKITSGSFNGVDLAGVRAVAAVASNVSLGDDQGARKSELTVDSSTTPQQSAALAALLESKIGAQIGPIVAIHTTPISFTHTDTGYIVNAAGFATMNVSYRTDNSCCVQPGLVWFNPLSPVEHRKVGYTELATFTGTVADHWQRADEDGAFYGAIAF